jgi:serine/threonine-protein kinase
LPIPRREACAPIIHRDLKPDNVIIVSDAEAPGGERAKVLDFGIAKISDDKGPGAANGLTQMGAVMGTPRYMSPEQCKGSANVDGKTDVYALGVLLFMMLTGKAPFDAEGTGALMAMHIYQPPPKPTDVEPTVSPAAEALVLSMLAKEPQERPAMAQVVTELERIGAASTQALPVLVRNSLSHQQLGPVPAAVGFEHSGSVNNSRPSLAVVGQTQDPTSIKSGATRVKRLLIPAIMASVLSGIGIAVVLRQSDGDANGKGRHGAVAATRKVVWEVKSTPPGVEVVRVTDGAVLGKTPWRQEEPAGSGKVGLTLRHAGYMDKQVLLDKDKDCSEEVLLDPVPAAEPPPAVAPEDTAEPASPKPHRSRKSGKTKEAPKADDESDLAPVH